MVDRVVERIPDGMAQCVRKRLVIISAKGTAGGWPQARRLSARAGRPIASFAQHAESLRQVFAVLVVHNATVGAMGLASRMI